MTVKQRVIASLLVEKAAENRELADKVGLICRLKPTEAMRKISDEGRRRRMKIIGKILLGIVGVIAALYLIVFITAWL